MATTLTTSQMKDLVRFHFEDFVDNHKAEAIHRNMTPDFYDHDGPGHQPAGRKGDEDMMVGMRNAMPDLRLAIEELVAEGELVVCRNVWRWTDPVVAQLHSVLARTSAVAEPPLES